MSVGQSRKGKGSIAGVVRKFTRRSAGTVDSGTPHDGRSTAAPLISDEQIRARAYELFLSRGGVHGDDWLDWFRAQHELAGQGR